MRTKRLKTLNQCFGVAFADLCIEVGLDREEVAAFLSTNELEAEVWASYGSTIERGIHAIPYFVFNLDGHPSGGFFGDPQARHWTVNGSGSEGDFLGLLEEMHSVVRSG